MWGLIGKFEYGFSLFFALVFSLGDFCFRLKVHISLYSSQSFHLSRVQIRDYVWKSRILLLISRPSFPIQKILYKSLTPHRSTNLVKIAKQHEPHDVLVADNLALPHPSGVFDFAISIAVVHHLSTPARRIEAVKCVLDLLRRPSSSHAGGQALIYVWALEQKDSRRGWDEGHEQDVMVPWVLKQKKEKEAKRRKKRDADIVEEARDKEEKKEKKPEGDKTFLRYYHLYRKGELESDIEQAGGVVLESGYEKDNWWAIARLR